MARFPKTLKDNLRKYRLNFPTDRRTREFKNYLRENDLTFDDYIFTLKEIVKLEQNKIKNKDNRIRKYDEKIRNRLTALTNPNVINIDYEEFLSIQNLNRNDYKRQIQKVLGFAKNYSNNDNRIIFRVNNEDQYYTINDAFINRIGQIDLVPSSIGGREGSDVDVVERAVYDLERNPIRSITFESIERTNAYNSAQGAYFPYYCEEYDLSRYQIFRNSSESNLSDNCLIYALRILGLEECKLDLIKTAINNDYVNKTKLKDFCNQLKITIELYEKRKDDGRTRSTKYGSSDRIFKIALYENHYFIYECFENTTSLNFIKYLVDNKDKYLIPLDYSNIKEEYKNNYKLEFSESLDYDDTAIKSKEFKDAKETDAELVFADFETYNDNIHIPYLFSIRYDKTNEVKNFIGLDCAKQFIDYINKRPEKNLLLIFHNAKYDYNFLAPHICITNEINSDGHFKSLTGFTYKKVKLTIRCSYNLFNFALRDCPKLFMTKEEQSKIKKEVMPYDLYNQEGYVNKRYIPKKDILVDYFKSKADYNEFFDNCYEWDCYDSVYDTIDIIEYSKIYCQMDVLILSKCYNKFREWCLEDFKLDVNNYLTISSIADAYFTKNDCYEGVNQISLNVQNFIMKSVYGGRVMTANNERIYIEGKINDFDAVSLYPSAMNRLSFPKGNPKVLKQEQLNLEFLKTTDAYFVEIKITKVGIRRTFPILSTYEEGIRDYTNDMIGEVIIVNNITLEDLIKFQKVEFEILKGYYYNEGTNYKIQEVIQYVFDKRVQLKKIGNPAEIIYKLLMNSAYGKTIQKAHVEDFVFIYGNDKLNSYISKNYNNIISYQKIPNSKCNKIKLSKSTFGFFNLAHIGSLILSMSKRIMNEVMCLAEDNQIDIYYQDTDSMHLKDVDIPKLEKLFKETYNRDLIGKTMGQFHSDFSLPNVPKDTEVYSTKLIALGKKCYADKLEGVDSKGNIYHGYHIRLKGVSGESIKYEAKRREISELDIYELLYKGEEIEFDLTCNNKKTCFKFHKNYSVTTQTDFKRKIKFTNSRDAE